MKLPRDVSGRDLVKVLVRDWGYRQVHQVGSHIILQTDTPSRTAYPSRTIARCDLGPSTPFSGQWLPPNG